MFIGVYILNIQGVQEKTAESWRGRGGKLSRILEKKNTIFNEHSVSYFFMVCNGNAAPFHPYLFYLLQELPVQPYSFNINNAEIENKNYI